MNIQERIEALETEFAEKIKQLKAEMQREDEFPQYGDTYWCINAYGGVSKEIWDGYDIEKDMLEIGNGFRTEQEAEFAVEKLKVETELRKFSKPFEEREDNWMFMWNGYDDNFVTERFSRIIHLGAIYFESEEKAQQAIESVGEERIKKYIFGVEE